MKGYHEPRSSSSCAACKFLKRKCITTCIFAPYFRSNDSAKFAKVHKVFGASNVSKILSEVPEGQREETVNSLAYEADVRLKDPVYGCIGAITLLQTKMIQLQHDLAMARARLAHAHYSTNSSSSSSSSSSFLPSSSLSSSYSSSSSSSSSSFYNIMMDSISDTSLAALSGWSTELDENFSNHSLMELSQLQDQINDFSYVPYVL